MGPRTGVIVMRESVLVTDAELARARSDPAFRQQLVGDSLELLLAQLNKLRALGANPARARQIREGVDLAVKLADLLQRLANTATRESHAA
jgi:hypothetical protein